MPDKNWDEENEEADKEAKEKEEKAKKAKPPTMVEEANKAAERIEAANKVTTELVERQEALAAQNALGGKSDAGEQTPEPKEESPAEYANKVMANDVETKDT